MFDKNKLDSFFEDVKSTNKNSSDMFKHTKIVRMSKLILPVIAALIVGLLLIIPSVKDIPEEMVFDITKPKFGELEKLHVENTVFYITDADNKVSNFNTAKIDETSPGSKLIKLSFPEGKITAKDDSWVNVKSNIGYYNQNTNFLNLEEKTEVFFSEGMDLETEKINFDFTKSFGYTDTPIIGTGNIGQLNSEGLEFFPKNKIIIFKGKTFIKINDENMKKDKK